MLENFRSLQFHIPLGRKVLRDHDLFDVVLVHRKESTSCSSQSNSSADLVKFHDFQEIRMGMADGVCRIWTGQRDDPKSVSFIVKFAISVSGRRHKELEQEAENYSDHLRSLQGCDIPICFGLFEGERLKVRSETPVRFTCIILEDCGDAVRLLFPDLPLADRAQILKRIGHIHQCGVFFDDFAEGNVVHRDGSYRIIGFRYIETGHKCLWKDGSFYEGEVVPKVRQIGCALLHNFGLEFGLWKMRDTVSIFAKNVPKHSFPSQEAIEVLLTGLGTFHSDNEKRLHNWIKNFREHEDAGMTPEEYKEKFPVPDLKKAPRNLEDGM